jgi:hypothetical protein
VADEQNEIVIAVYASVKRLKEDENEILSTRKKSGKN